MRRALRDDLVIAWNVLVGATLITWWLGADHPLASDSVEAASAVALVIAFAKAWLIAQRFMGVRAAPTALKLLVNLWVVAFGTACVVLVAVT